MDFRNKKGEVKLIPMIVGMLAMFLFVSVVGLSINMMGGNYDTSGYDEDDLARYNFQANLSADIASSQGSVENVVMDPNIFDYLAGFFNKLLSPFRTVYRAYTTMITMSTSVVSDLNLLHPIRDFLITAIVLIVVIGIVMLEIYLGKQK